MLYPCFRAPVPITHDPKTFHVATNKEGCRKWAFWQDWNYGLLSTDNSTETSLFRYVLDIVNQSVTPVLCAWGQVRARGKNKKCLDWGLSWQMWSSL